MPFQYALTRKYSHPYEKKYLLLWEYFEKNLISCFESESGWSSLPLVYEKFYRYFDKQEISTAPIYRNDDTGNIFHLYLLDLLSVSPTWISEQKSLKNIIFPYIQGHNLPVFFHNFANRIRKAGIKMKLKYYQISIRYENKMHDFHGWGVAVQIWLFL